MSNRLDHMIIDINLAGLHSDDWFTRELSIFQLQNYLADEKVQVELVRAKKKETHPDLKQQLQSLLDLISIEAGAFESWQEDEIAPQKPDEIWFKHANFTIDELLKQLEELDADDQIDTLCRIIKGEKNSLRLIPLFSKPHKLLKSNLVLGHLAAKLNSKNDIFLIRLLIFLSRNAPAYILNQLKPLLAHENFYVKVLALKTLFQFAPSQAIRLLNELVIVRKSNIAACNLLFLFPFENIKNIVTRLIEQRALSDTAIQKAIENLVLNNPDPEFFEQLVRLELLRGKEIPEIRRLRFKALDSLDIAGFLTKDKASFCEEAFARNASFLFEQTGLKIGEDSVNSLSSPVQNESLQTETAENSHIECIIAKDQLSKEDEKKLKHHFVSGYESAASLMKAVKKFKLNHGFVIKWLEDQLSEATPDLKIIAMQLLSELKFSRLLPHLPVLCLDQNRNVSANAIRIFRKHARRKLLKCIEQWLKEDNDKTWKASLTGLLQVRVDDARMILLQHFERTERVSFIKFFSPVFHVSPDFQTLFELEKILSSSRGAKREALCEQIELLKKALGVIKNDKSKAIVEISQAGLQMKWDEISDSLEKFSYLADETELVERTINFIKSNRYILLAAFSIFLLALIYWQRPASNVVQKEADNSTLQGKTTQAIPRLEIGMRKFMTLNSYDPINQFWQATGSDGTIYKLKLIRPDQYSPGFKGNFKILAYRISFLGYPVVSCKHVTP
ncbi:MAG: hypothetical protein ACQETH_05555 [Candidatus Rifleibacteriota bacterium]